MIKGHLAYKLPRHPWNRPETLRGVKYVVGGFITVYPALYFKNGFAYKYGRSILFSDMQDTRNMRSRDKRLLKKYLFERNLGK